MRLCCRPKTAVLTTGFVDVIGHCILIVSAGFNNVTSNEGLLIVFCAELAVSLLLLYGTHKGIPWMIISWLYVTILCIIILIFFTLFMEDALLIAEPTIKDSDLPFMKTIAYVVLGLWLVIHWCLWLLVLKHYRELTELESSQGVLFVM